MAAPAFWFTPLGEGSETLVDFGAGGIGRLALRLDPWGAQVETHGGQVVSQLPAVVRRFELERHGVGRTADAALWAGLQAFTAHAKAGGLFRFAADQARAWSGTLAAGAMAGDTTLNNNGVAVVSVGDDLLIRHAYDPRIVEVVNVILVPVPATTLGTSPLLHDYAAGSRLEHLRYTPAARLDPPIESALVFSGRGDATGLEEFDLFARVREVV